MVQFDKEAGQTRDCCVAKSATRRAARPDPSRRKRGLLGMTTKLHHYREFCRDGVRCSAVALCESDQDAEGSPGSPRTIAGVLSRSKDFW